jgi:hypothetical protein
MSSVAISMWMSALRCYVLVYTHHCVEFNNNEKPEASHGAIREGAMVKVCRNVKSSRYFFLALKLPKKLCWAVSWS